MAVEGKILNKRIRFFLSTGFLQGLWLVVVKLVPFEFKYLTLFFLAVVIVFVYSLALRISWKEKGLIAKMWPVYVLPILFFWGWAMFIFLFDSWLIVILASFLFFLVNYVILLVDNLFLVTVSYKAIPLYRTASSVNLLLVLSSSFLLFDVFGSFYLPFWLLASLVFVVVCLFLTYLFWSVSLVESGLEWRDWQSYPLVAGLLVFEFAVVLSWWPVGIFLRSVYLMLALYVLAVLMQHDLRGRFFKKTWREILWVGLGALIGLFWVTRWRAF